MRKLVLILMAFIAVVTFIRAYENIGSFNANEAAGISENLNEELWSTNQTP